MSETVAAIRAVLQTIHDPADTRFAQWAHDPRQGVQQALAQWQRQYQKQTAARQAFVERLAYERHFWEQGYTHVAGVDEVGRGPLAGPVVSAAVILPHDFYAAELIDSKQLSEKQRNRLFESIQANAVAINVSIVSAAIIDQINIYQAARQAMTEAVEGLATPADAVLLDAMTIPTAHPQQSIIKGDARSNAIAAASIIAKVTRDRLMADYAAVYPDYGFDQHMGYGTKQHLKALNTHGVTPIHRRTFAPVKKHLS